METLKSKIDSLLVEGKVNDVLDLLYEAGFDSKRITLISRRLYDLEENKVRGTITNEAYNTSKNKIVSDVIDSIENGDTKGRYIFGKNSISLKLIARIGLLLFALVLFGVYYSYNNGYVEREERVGIYKGNLTYGYKNGEGVFAFNNGVILEGTFEKDEFRKGKLSANSSSSIVNLNGEFLKNYFEGNFFGRSLNSKGDTVRFKFSGRVMSDSICSNIKDFSWSRLDFLSKHIPFFKESSTDSVSLSWDHLNGTLDTQIKSKLLNLRMSGRTLPSESIVDGQMEIEFMGGSPWVFQGTYSLLNVGDNPFINGTLLNNWCSRTIKDGEVVKKGGICFGGFPGLEDP